MIDLVVVGKMFPYMETSIPKGVNVIEETFDFETGYNAALNRGAKRGSAEFIGFCNNDLLFHHGSIDKLVEALKKGFDSVSPWCPLTHLDWWDRKPQSNFEGFQTGKVLAGWCYFMKRKSYNKLNGGFDERLKFWACDNATSEQFYQTRIQHGLIVDSLVEHKQSQTLNKLDGVNYKKMTLQQLDIFKKVYGFSCFDKKYTR